MANVEAEAVVDALAVGIRESLGELASAKRFGTAITLLESQCRELAKRLPGVPDAVRTLSRGRVAAYAENDAEADELASDCCDPNHAYYLLCVSRPALRRFIHDRRHRRDSPAGLLIGALRSARPIDDGDE